MRILLSCLLTAFVTLPVRAADRERVPGPGECLSLLSPKSDDGVESVVNVVGRMHAQGTPIVLVRPAEAGSSWWIQTTPLQVENGFFRTTIRLGNEETPEGSRFYLVAALLRDVHEAYPFVGRPAVEKLPAGVPFSQVTAVTLQSAPQQPAVKPGGTIVHPEAKQVVASEVEVLGRVTAAGQPVVLIRSSADGGRWWVQRPAQLDGRGNFRSVIRVGNDRTEDGARFRLIMVTVDPRQVAALLAAESVADIPPRIPRSNEVEVILARGIPNRAP